ncbi:electron transport complex subunit RsxG [Alteromonas sp. ASW11-36]|uniref:Ion-translocating oxidoreductase complex subunit G n=1 Tax=Alteromonas arenosi TaxID=3055817 RepID=A0ABT7SV06_9ALTE|nr:electron transport complex subunit RsxG [Alteromonas sp. ASW11-36]MDM7860021.1 electron transport complex subunit RsxG [Alteromonas sp. ASW11-36]
MINNIYKNGAILAAFALATTGLIGLTFLGTKGQIEQQRNERLQATLVQVMPDDMHDNALAESCISLTNEALSAEETVSIYRATKAGDPIGFVIESTAPNGYSGNIHMLVGMLLDGTITGVRVLDHKETPGLGDKINLRISDWILSFNGKVVSPDNAALWDVKKNGGQFDQFTGATITPRAVVKQVELTALTAAEHTTEWLDMAANCQVVQEMSNE